MSRRILNTPGLLPITFLALLFATLAVRGLRAQSVLRPYRTTARPETGTFPATWINGVDCDSEPVFQVHAYNDDLYILRQSKCSDYEAPFLYLIFGQDKALLLDTGSRGEPPVAATVTGIVNSWLAATGKSFIELIVAHTHGHSDHIMGDDQFENMLGVTVVGWPASDVFAFWGFGSYESEVVQFDLGDRVLDVIGTPGHAWGSITVYDRRTQLLLTGDIVYPGHLFVFSDLGWSEFKQSIDFLVDFAAANPVEWVLGCHIEMTSTPGVPYEYGELMQPDEHVLQLEPSILLDIQDAHQQIGNSPVCRVFDEFVIHPVHVCGF